MLTQVGDGKAVLLNLDTKFYYTLNATSLVMWQVLSEGGATAQAIADALVKKFRVDAETASRDTEAVLSEMLAERLVTVSPT